MEVRYGADLYSGYIRMEVPEEADFQTYGFKMLEKNRIRGVLSTKIRMEDGKAYLYLEVHGQSYIGENQWEAANGDMERSRGQPEILAVLFSAFWSGCGELFL